MKQPSLFPQFARYVSLNIAGMVGLSCYIMADTFFIAQGLGAQGLAALNLAIPVFNVLHGLGLMIGMGGGVRFSMGKDRSDQQERNRIFSQMALLAAMVAVVMVLLGIFGAEGIARLMGADDQVMAMTTVYIRVILLFAPAFLMNNLTLCFVRNDGEPALAMAGMLSGSFLNIILDYVFIFPLGMGMFGAVIATCIAPICSLGVLSLHFLRRKHTFRFQLQRPQLSFSLPTASLGVSSFISEVASGVVIVVFNYLALSFGGNTAVAAYGVIANISLVITAVFTGIAQGMQPLLSGYFGSGEFAKAKKIYHYAIGLALVLAVGVYVLLVWQAQPVVALFNSQNDPQLASLATDGIRYYFLAFVFVGWNIITAVRLGAMNLPRPSFLISIARGLVFILPAAFAMAFAFGITGMWLSFPVAEGLTFLLSLALRPKNK